MRELGRWLVSPDMGDEDMNRRAQVANLTSVFIMVAVPLVMLVETLAGSSPFTDPLTYIYLPLGVLVPLVSLVLIRWRRPQAGIYWLLIVLTVVMSTSSIPYGMSPANFTILSAVIILSAMLAGGRGIALTVTAGMTASAMAYQVGQAKPGVNLHALQNEVLMQMAIFPLLGLLTWLFSRNLTSLARRARQQARDIAALNQQLEQRLAELVASTQRLQQTSARNERRAQRLATAAEASRDLSATLVEPEELLDRVVELVRERLDAYYVGIFLLDEAGRYVDLRAGTGEAGRRMVAQGYRIMVGGTSAIGGCVASRQGRIAGGVDPAAQQSSGAALLEAIPLLPRTRSELALPLISQGRVLGAMAIRSATVAAFDGEDVTIFQPVADQVANAIASARLLVQTRAALAEATQTQQRYARDAWDKFLPTRQVTGYQRQGQSVQALSHRLLPEVRQAVGAARTLVSNSDEEAALITPLTLRGQVIGALGVQDNERREWVAADVAMVETIAEQVAQAVESARLFEQAQASLAEVTATYQRYLREAWSEYLPAQPSAVFEYVAADQSPVEVRALPAVKQAMSRGQRAMTRSAEAMTLAVPLTLRDQTLGVLGFQDDPERQWSEEEIAVIEAVADQIAQAVESSRLYDESQARLSEVETTHRLYLRQAWEEYLPLRQSAGFQFASSDVAPLDSIMVPEIKQALAHRRVTIASTNQDRATLATPIVLRGEVLGALGLQTEGAGHQWTSEDVELVEAVAEELGQAVESARLFEEAQYRAFQLQTAAEVSQAATAVLDFAALAEEAVNLLQQRFSLYYVGLFLLDETGEYAALRAGTGEAGRRMLAEGYRRKIGDHSTIGAGMADGKPRIAPDVDRERARFDNPWLPDTRTQVAVPLISRGQVIGALSIHHVRPRAFTDDDVTVFQTIAAQLANAIENARAYQELQRTAAQLKEMDQIKSHFLANMSHELRTPLNAIIGFSRVILKGIDGPLTENQQTDLTAIYENGQQLLSLINNVLDISKIAAGKMDITFAPVDLQPVIQSVMSTAVALVKDKPIELRQEVQPDLPIIEGDETRLRQVILNLVSNAAKFTEVGSIIVRAWADTEQVTVSVTDTGIGIAPEHQGLIFEEFRQVDGSLTRRAGGTGLGLPISWHLVEEHGGRMWVESALGEGSTFSFTVPLKRRPVVPLPEDRPDAEAGSSRPTILAIEGREGVIALYRRYLEKHGYEVIGLQEGAQALDLTRVLQPSVIVMDLSLPDKDGWAVLEELKSAPETRQIPVIVSTMDRDSRNQALRGGADAYLVKPVLEKDLLDALKTLEVE